MRKAVFALLISVSVSTAAAADDNRDVYDVFRGWLKPLASATVNEQVTARIKRDMASLLYPVEIASFDPPEKDLKFRDLIMMLQKQMGAPATGILTLDQSNRLAEAARDIDDRPIGLQPKRIVSRSDDGRWVSAVGTGAMEDIRNPINITRILCLKADSSCEMSIAEFDPKSRFLYFGSPVVYEIKTWVPSRVTAISEHPCGTALMTIDVNTEAVTIVTAPHADLAFCSKEPASIWTLVDGFPVVWKLHQDRVNKARALVYEPAQRLVPPIQDASPVSK
jgi:hypothetical protein